MTSSRITRSGKTFSPHESDPVLLPASFSLDTLLEKAMLAEDEFLQEDSPINHDDPPKRCSPGHDPSPLMPASKKSRPGGSLGSTLASPASDSKAQPALSGSHRRRNKKRAAQKETVGHARRPSVAAMLLNRSAEVETNLATEGLPAASGGYSGKATRVSSPKAIISPSKAISLGLKLIPWDGKQPRPILDAKGRIVALLAGQPSDSSTYSASCEAVCAAILEEGRLATFSLDERRHRRGKFPALNFGVTHGMGSHSPVNLNNGVHDAMIRRLRGDENLQRLAAFASSTFATWNPGVYAYYQMRLNALFSRMPHLERIFKRSVFPSAAVNFGPQVCTFKHCDLLNCPFGWCAIQALGSFDPTRGGHIMLWELGLVVEFPPNSLIYIPSATITHSNCPVGKGETRVSFTQYCAGGLLRYVDNGFRTETEFLEEDPPGYQDMCKLKGSRWKEGLHLLNQYKTVS